MLSPHRGKKSTEDRMMTDPQRASVGNEVRHEFTPFYFSEKQHGLVGRVIQNLDSDLGLDPDSPHSLAVYIWTSHPFSLIYHLSNVFECILSVVLGAFCGLAYFIFLPPEWGCLTGREMGSDK